MRGVPNNFATGSKEYDQFGLSDFLKKYAPRGRARSHFLVHDGKLYNMKAIWWAATAEQPPQNDHTNDARRDLESIGFIRLKGSELAAAVRRSDAIDDLGSDTPDKINISSVRYERDQKIREAVKRRAGGNVNSAANRGSFAPTVAAIWNLIT